MPILSFFADGDFDKLPVTARAVAQADPGSTTSGDFALYALKPCGKEEDFEALNWSGNTNGVQGSAHSNSGAFTSGNDQYVTGDLSVTCDGSNISDKDPWNNEGSNPALSPSSSSVVPDCTGGEAAGEACRQDITPPVPPDYAALYQECDYSWTSDADPSSDSGVWSAPGGDLFAGVYCSTGKLSFSNSGIEIVPTGGREGITILADDIVWSGDGSVLTPHLDGILMYANTTEKGKGVDYSANSGDLEGILWSPWEDAKVQFQGNDNTLTGALVGYNVDYSGEDNLLIGTFEPQSSGPPTVALIE